MPQDSCETCEHWGAGENPDGLIIPEASKESGAQSNNFEWRECAGPGERRGERTRSTEICPSFKRPSGA